MTIPTILKGDDSGAITISLPEGRDFTGATLVLAYGGVTRSFTDLVPGATLSFGFTHDETADFKLGCKPVLMRLIGPSGSVETVENAAMKIKVTDCLGEVNAGGSFVISPRDLSTSVPVTDLGDLSTTAKIGDLYDKVNEIVRVLAQRSLLVLTLCLGLAAGAGVQTARLEDLDRSSVVVTNVTGSSGVDTNAVRDIALWPATNYTDRATGEVIRSVGALADEVSRSVGALADTKRDKTNLTVKVTVGWTDNWSPNNTGFPPNPSDLDDCYGDIVWSYGYNENTNVCWRCYYYVWYDELMSWESIDMPEMGGEFDNRNAIMLTFPDGVTKAYRDPITRDDTIALVSQIQPPPVTSVNSQTGAVTLSASDVGAVTTQDLTDAISTNNPAFVSAVRSTPPDPETPWGTYGTLGAAIAGIIAALANKLTKGLDAQGVPTDPNVAELFSESDTSTAANPDLNNKVLQGSVNKLIDVRLPIPLVAKTGSFTTESYKRFTVVSMPSAGLTLTMHTPTGSNADVFECRFNGADLSADASVSFTGATVTKMEGATDTGVVKAGKVALMSAFWNGATWDVNWKVEG